VCSTGAPGRPAHPGLGHTPQQGRQDHLVRPVPPSGRGPGVIQRWPPASPRLPTGC
jgi:hypothetical protein